MDRLESMAVVVTAAEVGSLSEAARRLRMPLTTVSRRVADLEAHLSARLFTRTSRRVSLTESGHAFVEASRRILEEVDQAERAAAGEYLEPRGTLVITAPLVFGRLFVLPVVTGFLEQHPQVSIQLHLVDGLVNLQEERVDLAVRIGALPDSSLHATRVGSMRQVVCGSAGYLAKHGRPRRPTDLREHACVTRTPGNATQWTLRVKDTPQAVEVRSRLVVNTAEAAVDAVRAGMGLTQALHYQVDDAVRAGALELVLTTFEPLPLPVNLVYASSGLLPVKVRAFLDVARPQLQQRLRTMSGSR